MPKPAVAKPYTAPAFMREPDLVDRIFEYIAAEFPQIGLSEEEMARLKPAVRDEFCGQHTYIAGRLGVQAQRERIHAVLALFNGRNPTEIARRLGISRATVYRIVKQAGRALPIKLSQVSKT